MRCQFENRVCPFCTIDPEVNTILLVDEFVQCWHVNEVFMRPELLLHFIITPKRHLRFPWEMRRAEHVSIAWATEQLAMHYPLAGGIIATRFGDMRLNAGTVPHLHVNIMVPNRTDKVKVPVFKDSKERKDNQARAAAFAARYESSDS